MNSRLAHGVGAVLAIAVAAGCQSARPPSGPPSATDEATSAGPGAHTPASVAVPEALRHPWIWAGDVAAGVAGTHPYIIGFDTDGRTVGAGEDQVSNVVGWDGARLTLALQADGSGCVAGQLGEFHLDLTPSGRRMTVTEVHDPCADRADRLAGTWLKSDCPTFPDNFCLGDLDPGRYHSTYFTPHVLMADWEFAPGAMTYTVPAGWSNPWDFPDEFSLKPAGETGDRGIFMWSEVAIVSSSAPCTPQPDAAIGRDPKAIIDWLSAQPTLVASEAQPVLIGGLEGFGIDAKTTGDQLPCMGDGRPFSPILVHPEGTGMQWGLGPDEHGRFYAVDLGGRSLVVEIAAPDKEAFETLLPEADAIVKTLGFQGG